MSTAPEYLYLRFLAMRGKHHFLSSKTLRLLMAEFDRAYKRATPHEQSEYHQLVYVGQGGHHER